MYYVRMYWNKSCGVIAKVRGLIWKGKKREKKETEYDHERMFFPDTYLTYPTYSYLPYLIPYIHDHFVPLVSRQPSKASTSLHGRGPEAHPQARAVRDTPISP